MNAMKDTNDMKEMMKGLSVMKHRGGMMRYLQHANVEGWLSSIVGDVERLEPIHDQQPHVMRSGDGQWVVKLSSNGLEVGVHDYLRTQLVGESQRHAAWCYDSRKHMVDGREVYVMVFRYVGRDLLASFHLCRWVEEDEVMRRMLEVAMVMQDVHACGIVHRDIKPDNLYMDKAGTLRVGDFGSAAVDMYRIRKRCDCPVRLSQMCELQLVRCGTTWAYTPPEHWKDIGEGRRKYGMAGDVWALGATFMSTVTGKSVRHLNKTAKGMPGTTAHGDALVRSHLTKGDLTGSEVGDEQLRRTHGRLYCLWQRMLRVDPEERIGMGEVVDWLRAHRGGGCGASPRCEARASGADTDNAPDPTATGGGRGKKRPRCEDHPGVSGACVKRGGLLAA